MRLFSSGGRWRRKRSWDDWKCLGHGGSPGTRSLHAPRIPLGAPRLGNTGWVLPAAGRLCQSSGGSPCRLSLSLDVSSSNSSKSQRGGGEEGKFDPPAGTIFSQGMLCSRGLECTGARHVPGWAGCCLRGAGAAPWAGGGLSLPQSCGFSCKAHGASGWESRSLQDPFSKRFRLAGSLIDCLID